MRQVLQALITDAEAVLQLDSMPHIAAAVLRLHAVALRAHAAVLRSHAAVLRSSAQALRVSVQILCASARVREPCGVQPSSLCLVHRHYDTRYDTLWAVYCEWP